MDSTHKDGWTYIYSEELKQELAFKPGVYVMAADKTIYSMEEIELLNRAGCKVVKTVHLIKKMFNGEIVAAEKSREIFK